MRLTSGVVAAGALAISVACCVFTYWRWTTPAQAVTAEPQARSAPASPADPRVHMLSEVIGNKPELTDDDANTLIASYLGETDLVIQRWALVIAGDRLRHARMDDSVRHQLEAMVIQAMDDQNWRIRRCAIASIDGSPLSTRRDVLEKIQSLAEDPQPEVAARARLALGLKPPQ